MFKKTHFHIGRRILKTSVSAAAAMLLANLFNVEFPSLAIVAAVIILQPTLYETYKQAEIRMIGTLLGSALGLFCVKYINIDVTLEIFFGVLLILMVSNSFSITSANILGIIAFASIVTDPNPSYMTAFNRIVNTTIGASTSIFLNFIFPANVIEKKSCDITQKILMLDLKLLMENLKSLAGDSVFTKDDFSQTINDIIKEFNEAYSIKVLMRHEQKFTLSAGGYAMFNDKYSNLWDIHNCVIQIHNEIELAGEISFSAEIGLHLADIIAILDEITSKNVVSNALEKRFETSVWGLEKAFTQDFDSVSYSEAYEEGSFFTILLINLKRLAEDIKEV